MSVTCYPSPGKRKGLKICRMFTQGCAGNVVEVGASTLQPGPAFFYGMTEHSLPLITRCQEEGRDWYYADNAYYFGRGRYFRITKNGLMHDGSGDAGPGRFREFELVVRPWRRRGGHIVVVTQSDLFYRFRLGVGRDEWTRQIIENLRLLTDREVVVCDKPSPPWHADTPHRNFEAALPGAWAVVSHSSSVMVKALLDGIPVFSLGASMASSMGLSDLSRIEEPAYPDGREPWLWNLAANQWNREEMRNGSCWRDLNRASGRPGPGSRLPTPDFCCPPWASATRSW